MTSLFIIPVALCVYALYAILGEIIKINVREDRRDKERQYGKDAKP